MTTTEKMETHLDILLWPEGDPPKDWWKRFERREKADKAQRDAAISRAREYEPLLLPNENTRAEAWTLKVNYHPYWVTFANGKRACVHAPSVDEAKAIGTRLQNSEALSAKTLPYPATPELNPTDGIGCPPFCYSPDQCAGRGACPKSYACSE